MSLRPFLLTIAIFIFLGLAVIGCAAPSPLVGLRPRDPNVIWVAGRASVQKEASGVRVAAAFEHQDGDRLAVRIEIENKTQERIDVGPNQVVFVACTAETNASCSPGQRAIDPEAVLTALNKQQSVEAANAANDEAFNTPLLLLSAVSDIATIASGKGNSTTGLQTAAIANNMENDSAVHNTALSSIAIQRQIWSDVAFRRNTLFPGKGIGGLVYLPIDLRARFVWMRVYIPHGPVFPFYFEQVVTPVVSENGGIGSTDTPFGPHLPMGH